MDFCVWLLLPGVSEIIPCCCVITDAFPFIVVFSYLDVWHFVYPSTSGWAFGLSPVLSVMNNVMNIYVYVFVWVCAFHFSRSGNTRAYGYICLLLRNSNSFLKWLHHFIFSSVIWRFYFLYRLPTFSIVILAIHYHLWCLFKSCLSSHWVLRIPNIF